MDAFVVGLRSARWNALGRDVDANAKLDADHLAERKLRQSDVHPAGRLDEVSMKELISLLIPALFKLPPLTPPPPAVQRFNRSDSFIGGHLVKIDDVISIDLNVGQFELKIQLIGWQATFLLIVKTDTWTPPAHPLQFPRPGVSARSVPVARIRSRWMCSLSAHHPPIEMS
jgi:hypothetical protein